MKFSYLFYGLIGIWILGLGWELMILFQRPTDLQIRTESRKRRAATLGKNFDARLPFEVIDDFARAGVEVYPVIYPTIIRNFGGVKINGRAFLPRNNVANAKVILSNEHGSFPVYDLDELGFPNPKELLLFSRNIDNLIVGDSFAFGACAKPEESVGHLLRANYPRTIVLANNGISTLDYLKLISDFAPTLRPKVTFWLHYEMIDLASIRFIDPDEYQKGEFSEGPLDYFANRAFLSERLSEIARKYQEQERAQYAYPGKLRRMISERPKLSSLLSLTWLYRQIVPRPVEVGYWRFPIEEVLAKYGEILSSAQKVLAPWKGKIVFVFLPGWDAIKNPAWLQSERLQLLEMVRAMGIPVIDFKHLLVATGRPFDFFPNGVEGHYTGEGYALLASELRKMAQYNPTK
jgi:hypothetical protein